jgi:hypothetical protein
MQATRKKLAISIMGAVILALLVFSTLDTSMAFTPSLDLTPTAYVYLPYVANPYTCPTSSTNQYSGGIAYQYDQDDPVRPAYNHADKNIELRGYTVNTETNFVRDLVDYEGTGEPTLPPQLATLFEPTRVPTLTHFYRVHHWQWADPPEPGTRGSPITEFPATALGLQTTAGETLHVPQSGHDIGKGMEVLILFADEDSVALRYTREDSSAPNGYTVHVDNICTDPNLLALYNALDDPSGPRHEFPNSSYTLPNLPEDQAFGTARDTEIVVAIADTGAFMDVRSCDEWWRVRPGYGACAPVEGLSHREHAASPSVTPTLGGLSDTLSFTYDIREQRLLPAGHRVTPQNVGSGDPLTWTVAAEGDWFTVEPLSGTTPASFWITPTIFSTSTVATYTGTITVTVTDPIETEGSPHPITLTLTVTHTPFVSYLPLIARNFPPPPILPNDPDYGNQWALEKVDAPRAWNYATGKDILIAVIDTGVDLDHPDLADKVRTDIDWDFVSKAAVADDDHGHGTHVAGIAAAATDNEIGVTGMGWDAMILPLKVTGPDGEGEDADLAEAIVYAANKGADVINMSLGGITSPCCSCPSIVQDAVDDAHAKGVVLVASSGNHGGIDGPNAEMFPANCEHVLGIAATGSNDVVAPYSNYGAHVSVAAPGSSIYSTLMGDRYGDKSGTSMAAPHVAGLAALLRARFPSYTPDQIASAILDNAVDLSASGWDVYYGCGRIDAFQALAVGAHGSTPICLEGIKERAANVRETPIEASFVPGAIIVALRPGVRAETLSLRYGASTEFLPTLEAWRLRVPPGQEQAILAQLRADPSVLHADLNYLVVVQ